MLFFIEATVKVRDSRTVTDEEAYWLPATMKGTTFSKTEDTDFTSAKSLKHNMDCQLAGTPLPKKKLAQLKTVLPPTDDEFDSFMRDISAVGAESAILTVKADAFLPHVSEPKISKAAKLRGIEVIRDTVVLG